MNAIRRRCASLRPVLLIGAAALAILPLLGDSAHAVTITGSTYAAATPTPPGHLVSTSNSYNLYNLTSVSANIRSDEIVSHAQSYASASVGPSGVTKTTGGLAWTDSPTNIDNLRGDVWNASASGTVIQANYTGSVNPPPAAQFQFSLPSAIAQSADPYYSDPAPPPTGYTDPTLLVPPVSGGMVTQGVTASGGGNPLPSFFDVFVNVEANAFNGTTKVPLFNGSYEFNPGTGAYTPSGNFVTDVFGNPAEQPEIVQTGSSTGIDYSLIFPQSVLGNTFQISPGTPFTVDIETSVSMGDPSNPGSFDFSGITTTDDVLGAGGSVTGQFLLTDPSNFTVSAVPEPSAICLAVFAAAGLLLQLRRRKQS